MCFIYILISYIAPPRVCARAPRRACTLRVSSRARSECAAGASICIGLLYILCISIDIRSSSGGCDGARAPVRDALLADQHHDWPSSARTSSCTEGYTNGELQT